jgi:hypothetical protein
MENIELYQRAIPLLGLPKTFHDAIQVAFALGFKFLWIDALCIQQGVIAELQEQIGLMGEMYAGSSLTIFATGADANSGLGVSRVGRIKKPTRVDIRMESDDSERPTRWYVNNFDFAGTSHETALPLFKRGWVLQEEILF